MALFVSVAMPSAALANPSDNPQAIEFEVDCDLDHDGAVDIEFVVVTFGNPTLASVVLDAPGVITAVSGTVTYEVNGEVSFSYTFVTRQGIGVATVPCEAIASFRDRNGDRIDIWISGARFQLAMPKGTSV